MERISNIAERLREYRTNHGFSFGDMERLTGIPAQTLNRYELGQRSPKLDVAVSIAESLNVHPMWLQGYDVEETTKAPIKDDERIRKFVELFSQLTPEYQDLILAQLEGIVAKL